jgi:hypothetical protein
MTKWQLFSAMGKRGMDAKITINGITGVISTIQREDGSGSSFNVTLHAQNGSETKTVYVRTID